MRRFTPMLAVVLAALPIAARAAAPGPAGFPAPDPQVMQLRREIAALKLDRLLNLTPSQAKALLPIVQQGQQLRDQVRADHEQRKAAIVRALTAVRDDLKSSGAVSADSEKALLAARGAPNDQVRATARELRQRAQTVLTRDQLEALRKFDPRPTPGFEFGGPGEEMDGGGGPQGPGHGKMGGHGFRHGLLMHVVLSPEFQQLLEARAR